MTHLQDQYLEIRRLLLDLLDSPVTEVAHIGGTALGDDGIIDVLVIVPSLHAMTTLDEKRLNLAGFYRLHHPYRKKCVFSQFHSMTTLEEKCRLHIVEENSDKAVRYMHSHHLLSQSSSLLRAFRNYKDRIRHLPKKDYETEKADWFRMNIANPL
ncbi:GrpB family protein [Macrococcus carouselicus]|uniref:GrpB family protein n=1 Tax=Macrococcus carouselicus TaxID=69969 RepID=A0A9Q8FR40_9STAP|nr:GrpB family protein [Macrococcus carouselicus]TDM03664.1 GrpB family protein [Macrococcus carouselicus]